MELAEFVESLIMGKFGHIPTGHVRIHPEVHPEISGPVGDIRLLGNIEGVRFYADPAIPLGQTRFIDFEGKISILTAAEEKPVEAKKAGKKTVPRKRKARPVRTRSSKAD